MILLAYAVEKELRGWRVPAGVDALATGVGPVEAACAVATALCSRSYALVVNAGIAGAFADAAPIGEGVVICDETIELGLEDGCALALPDGLTVADKAFSDNALVGKLQARGFASLHGLTVTRVTATEETAHRLQARGAQVESMEGFAVLRCAQRAGVAGVEVRGISNRVGARDRSGWNFTAGVRGLHRTMDALFELLASEDESLFT